MTVVDAARPVITAAEHHLFFDLVPRHARGRSVSYGAMASSWNAAVLARLAHVADSTAVIAAEGQLH